MAWRRRRRRPWLKLGSRSDVAVLAMMWRALGAFFELAVAGRVGDFCGD